MQQKRDILRDETCHHHDKRSRHLCLSFWHWPLIEYLTHPSTESNKFLFLCSRLNRLVRGSEFLRSGLIALKVLRRDAGIIKKGGDRFTSIVKFILVAPDFLASFVSDTPSNLPQVYAMGVLAMEIKISSSSASAFLSKSTAKRTTF
jgi:hypothetical protein